MENYIKKLVVHYTKKYKTNDPFELADLLKIEVQKGNLGNYYGCYMYLKKHRCIFLNNDLDCTTSTLVLAHELGHAILHTKTNCCFMKNKTLLITSKIERQANIFAAELLISDATINEYKTFSIEQISGITGIDLELIKLKLGV